MWVTGSVNGRKNRTWVDRAGIERLNLGRGHCRLLTLDVTQP